MEDAAFKRQPEAASDILADTEALGFVMASDPKVGALLAASKPGGRLLELGTGTGHGTAWLLPQANWPDGHAPKVPVLIDEIERREGFMTVRLAWGSGLMLVVRTA